MIYSAVRHSLPYYLLLLETIVIIAVNKPSTVYTARENPLSD